jgi:hypothetical protein
VLFVFSSLVFSPAAGAWAANPEDAFSARPEASLYFALRLEDLGGMLKKIFSPANMEMLASLVDPEDAQGIRIAANLASQLPAKSVAFIAGMAGKADQELPFLQIAASMPEEVRAKLDLVAQGKATPEDLITLLLGDAGLLFAGELNPVVREGSKGLYYLLDELDAGSPVLAARENLLLIALSSADLEASLAATEKAENRLAFKRRFESPNYWLMHLDVPALASFAEDDLKKEFDLKLLKSYFKAPLDFEVAFDAKPGSFLVSSEVNALEALTDASRWEKIKPIPGAGLFLAGGGKLFLGLSSVYAFKASDWNVYPEIAATWGKFLKELEKRGLAEKDVEDLLTGAISLVFGSDATILGNRAPGGYIALSGQEGAASKILNAILEDEAFSQAVPLSPLTVDGWSSLFMVDPALVPVSLLLGVSKDTLFLGVVDPKGLDKKPEFPSEAADLFENDLCVSGFFDIAATWEFWRKEASDSTSPLGALLAQDPAELDIIKNLLESELAVSSFKLWAPTLETSFAELKIVDVPREKRLLPKLLKAVEAWESKEEDREEEKGEGEEKEGEEEPSDPE